jgi:hypothetical protein
VGKFSLSCFVLKSNVGVIKMKVTNWYKNGDLDAFHKFCTEHGRKLISVLLKSPEIEGKERVKGILYDHRLKPLEAAGVYILLTKAKVHPAFYALSDIESLHY